MNPSTSSGRGKLVLIDGNAILHRAYHALPKTFRTKKGEPINAVYGFVSMLLRIIADLKPTHIACAFDLKEPTFRKIEFADYQAHRPEMDKDLDCQFDKAKEVVSSFGIPIYEKAGFEADDVIGTIAKLATHSAKRTEQTKQVIIVTGDKDIFQLITDRVKVYCPIKGLGQSQMVGAKEVFVKLGVSPTQIVDYKALVGDPSDNYKGVPGVGPVTAVRLLKEYDNFENVYKNIRKIDGAVAKKLTEGKKSAKQSYKLAKILTNVPINFDLEETNKWSVGNSETLKLFEEFGFRTLKNRILAISGKKIDEKPSIEKIKGVVVKLAKLFGKRKYAIRGTASLVLQGIEMKVDDIDIICDKKTALLCNKIMKKYLTEKVELKESDKYKSYFGKFIVDSVLVEVYGEWQIKVTKNLKLKTKNWSKKYDASANQIAQIKVGGEKVSLTTIETELEMFAAMGRWNAYHKIKKLLEEKNQGRLF